MCTISARPTPPSSRTSPGRTQARHGARLGGLSFSFRLLCRLVSPLTPSGIPSPASPVQSSTRGTACWPWPSETSGSSPPQRGGRCTPALPGSWAPASPRLRPLASSSRNAALLLLRSSRVRVHLPKEHVGVRFDVVLTFEQAVFGKVLEDFAARGSRAMQRCARAVARLRALARGRAGGLGRPARGRRRREGWSQGKGDGTKTKRPECGEEGRDLGGGEFWGRGELSSGAPPAPPISAAPPGAAKRLFSGALSAASEYRGRAGGLPRGAMRWGPARSKESLWAAPLSWLALKMTRGPSLLPPFSIRLASGSALARRRTTYLPLAAPVLFFFPIWSSPPGRRRAPGPPAASSLTWM